jgi:hypothetical protein
VLFVHHRGALGEFGEVADDGVTVALAGAAAALLAHPLAVELGLGDDGEVQARTQA